MRDRRDFRIDAVSGIDEDLIDRHLKKRFVLWFKRGKRNPMRWIPLVAALLCMCILTTTVLLLLPGEEVDQRQVPIYTGMTVSNDPPTVLARAGELMQRTQMLSATAEDLLTVADIIDEVLADSSIIIVGGADHLDSLSEKPERIIKI